MARSGDPDPAFWDGKQVAVTGGAGFLGRPTVAMLDSLGADTKVIRSAEFDLTRSEAALEALRGADIVFHLAANVGGIGFNRRNPGPLFHDNMAMGLNVFEAARLNGIEKLVAVCSVCAYPKDTDVPFREESLWDGYPEQSNAPYGLAKKMLIVLASAYREQFGLDSCVPVLANLYGPNDNFDLADSHVIAAMVHKYVAAVEGDADEVILWGTGEPSREFLFVDDAARALVLTAERATAPEPFNVGTGVETRIRDLSAMIAEVAGFKGETSWDPAMPDGQMSRYLDVHRAAEMLGFESRVSLPEGIELTVESFRSQSE